MHQATATCLVVVVLASFTISCDNGKDTSAQEDSAAIQALVHHDALILDDCPVSLSPRFEVHMQIMGGTSMPLVRFMGHALGTPDEVWRFSFEREAGPNDAVWRADDYALVFDKDQLQVLSNIELHHDMRDGYVFYYLEDPPLPESGQNP